MSNLREEAVRLHRWVEDLCVTYGADGSLADEPYTPAVRERAGAAWVREGATAALMRGRARRAEATRR